MVEITYAPAITIASARRRVAWADVSRVIAELHDQVRDHLGGANGRRVVIYRDRGPDHVELECGLEVDGRFTVTGEVQQSETPHGDAAHLVHEGSRDELGRTTREIELLLRERGLPAGMMWLVYLDDDRTDVYILTRRIVH